MNKLTTKFFVPASYVLMVATNYIAAGLPLGGRTTGEIADSYANLFAPAGYTFSIWGVIYILLAAYVVYQFSRDKDELVAKINPFFIVGSILNASWMLAWHYDLILLSLLIMKGMLLTLIKIANILRGVNLANKETWLVKVPFGVYFGWITVATIANATVFLVSLGWDRFGLSEIFWTVAILAVGVLIGSWRTLYDRSLAYVIVLFWAYGGILAKHLAADGFDGRYPAVIWAVSLSLLVFLSLILFLGFKKSSPKSS